MPKPHSRHRQRLILPKHDAAMCGAPTDRYAKLTRRMAFLTEMERVVPWSALCRLIEPHYPKPGNGRPPVGAAYSFSAELVQPVGSGGGRGVPGIIEPALQAAETAYSAHRPTSDLTAYDLYLCASAMVLSSARQTAEALCLMEQAIARDLYYGPALAWPAFCCFRLLLHDRGDDREADRLKGSNFARRVLEVAGDDPGVLANAAEALAYFGEDIGAMMALVDRALALNPNFARGWHVSGVLRTWAGQPDIGIEHAEVSQRLSPRARMFPSLLLICAAHFIAGRFDEAVPKLLLAIQENPGFPEPYRYLAACYAHIARLEDARQVVARLRTITPVVRPDASYLRNTEHRELLLSGLRLAVREGV